MPNNARTAPCKNTFAPFPQGETAEHTLPQQTVSSHQIHRGRGSGIVPKRIIIVASKSDSIAESAEHDLLDTGSHSYTLRAQFPGIGGVMDTVEAS